MKTARDLVDPFIKEEGHIYQGKVKTPKEILEAFAERLDKIYAQQSPPLNREAIEKAISDVEDMHPYKEAGNRDSYSSYNQGWADACDILGQKILSLTSQEDAEERYNKAVDCFYEYVQKFYWKREDIEKEFPETMKCFMVAAGLEQPKEQ